MYHPVVRIHQPDEHNHHAAAAHGCLQELTITTSRNEFFRAITHELAALQLPHLSKLSLIDQRPDDLKAVDRKISLRGLAGAPWFSHLRSLNLEGVRLDAAGLHPLAGRDLPLLEDLSVQERPQDFWRLWDGRLPLVHLPKLKRLVFETIDRLSQPAVEELLAAQKGQGEDAPLEELVLMQNAPNTYWSLD